MDLAMREDLEIAIEDFVDDNYVNDMETAVRVVAAEDLGDFLVNFASDPCPPYSML